MDMLQIGALVLLGRLVEAQYAGLFSDFLCILCTELSSELINDEIHAIYI